MILARMHLSCSDAPKPQYGSYGSCRLTTLVTLEAAATNGNRWKIVHDVERTF
jgi:hypothetical protein